MILADLKAYLMARGPVAMSDLAAHFETTPDALRGMLDHWVRKGRVRCLDAAPMCSSCHKCAENVVEAYEWTAPARSEPHETRPAAVRSSGRGVHCSSA